MEKNKGSGKKSRKIPMVIDPYIKDKVLLSWIIRIFSNNVIRTKRLKVKIFMK